MFGGEFPTTVLIARIYPVHIFLVPAIIAALLAVHLGHALGAGAHASSRAAAATNGPSWAPAWSRPTRCALWASSSCSSRGAGVRRRLSSRSTRCGCTGLIRAVDATTASQPDWYTGWLEGGLRMFPPWDLTFGGFMLPAIFWPAVVLPGIVFGFLFLWPWIDAFATRDHDYPQPADPSGSARRARGARRRHPHGDRRSCSWAAATTCSPFRSTSSSTHCSRVLQGQLIGLPLGGRAVHLRTVAGGLRRPRRARDERSERCACALA